MTLALSVKAAALEASVSALLGHSTSRVTSDLYRHRVPELSEDAARRMQEAVG